MFIKLGEYEIELNTKLKTVRRIEGLFKLPLVQIFRKLEEATLEELVKILAVAADRASGEAFRDFQNLVEAEWDYADLQLAVQELVSRLHFTGTPDQINAKLDRFPMPEASKNAVRELLGLPRKTEAFGPE